MDDIERLIRTRLKDYIDKDIEFLKKEWNNWKKEGKWDLFEKKTGANVQIIYSIFNPDKIKRIRVVKSSRYEITVSHTKRYEVSILVKFDQPKKGNLGIITYYKHLVK